MRMIDIIEKKRDGHTLTTEEINFFIGGYVKGDIPDYQASSLAMAIYFQDMNDDERAALTMAMVICAYEDLVILALAIIALMVV